MNYRVIVTAAECRIVKTGAAAERPTVWPSLWEARAQLGLEVAIMIDLLRARRDAALRQRERDLPVEEAVQAGPGSASGGALKPTPEEHDRMMKAMDI